MKVAQSQEFELNHEEMIDVVKRGLKSKFGRKSIGKGIDQDGVKIVFTEEVADEVGTGRLESCTVTLPAYQEEILEVEAPAADAEATAGAEAAKA